MPETRVVAEWQAENKALQALVQQQAEGSRAARQRLKRLKERYAQLAIAVNKTPPSPPFPSTIISFLAPVSCSRGTTENAGLYVHLTKRGREGVLSSGRNASADTREFEAHARLHQMLKECLA